MPECVVAQLESLIFQELNLLEPPLALLPLDTLVTEQGPTSGCARQHAEDGIIAPVRAGFAEIQPDAQATSGIDFQGAILLDVAELAWTRVIEDEYGRRQPLRKVNFPVQNLRNGNRTVSALVYELKVFLKLTTLTTPAAVRIADKVVLKYGDLPELVWRSLFVRVSQSERR